MKVRETEMKNTLSSKKTTNKSKCEDLGFKLMLYIYIASIIFLIMVMENHELKTFNYLEY